MSNSIPASIHGFDPAVARALDLFDVPPPNENFLARMAAIADAAPIAATVQASASPWPARVRAARGSLARASLARGPWARRTVVGLIAVGLASATAAAAGMFESVRFEIPVIARLLAPSPPPVTVARAARPKHRAAMGKAATVEPVLPGAEATPVPIANLTGEQKIERLRALPMPVRVAITERIVTRNQRRLAARGIFLPRNVIRNRVIARTGQTDLPTGTPFAQRAQWRAALIAAPSGSLPPRLERMRARILANQPAAVGGVAPEVLLGVPSAPATDSAGATRTWAGSQNEQALHEWREMRQERRRRWQARQAELAQSGARVPVAPSPSAPQAPAAQPSQPAQAESTTPPPQ